MKIQIFSDIHCEAYSNPSVLWKWITPQADIAVVAGDIDARKFETTMTEIASKFEKVIYLLGNHEFYHKDVSWRPNINLMPDNVILLDRSCYLQEDVIFIGATLWSDFKNQDHWVMKYADNSINDFYMITKSNGGRKFTVQDAYDIHLLDKEYIKCMIELNRNKKIVIVTHFMPSYALVHPKWKSGNCDTLNYYFSSSCDDLVVDSGAAVFISGHTHDAYDTMLGDVRCVCNPFGYPGENRGKYKDLVIEV